MTKDIWPGILKLMQQQTANLQELLELTEQKQKMLLDNDIDGLNEIVAQEQLLIATVGKVEQDRQEVFADLAETFKLPPDATLQEILPQCPEEMAEDLRLNGQQMSLIMEKLANLNKQNVALINQSLEIIHYSINSLVSTRQRPAYHNHQEKENRGSLSVILDKKV